MDLLTIGNDGGFITETNYWDTEYNQKGILYLSINAGTFRLLLPDALTGELHDMKSAKNVIVSAGRGLGRDRVYEVLFDDDSDTPYCLHFGTEQADRVPPLSDSHRIFDFCIYTNGLTLAHTSVCYYRAVDKIPCMQPITWRN